MFPLFNLLILPNCVGLTDFIKLGGLPVSTPLYKGIILKDYIGRNSIVCVISTG